MKVWFKILESLVRIRILKMRVRNTEWIEALNGKFWLLFAIYLPTPTLRGCTHTAHIIHLKAEYTLAEGGLDSFAFSVH